MLINKNIKLLKKKKKKILMNNLDETRSFRLILLQTREMNIYSECPTRMNPYHIDLLLFF